MTFNVIFFLIKNLIHLLEIYILLFTQKVNFLFHKRTYVFDIFCTVKKRGQYDDIGYSKNLYKYINNL